MCKYAIQTLTQVTTIKYVAVTVAKYDIVAKEFCVT